VSKWLLFAIVVIIFCGVLLEATDVSPNKFSVVPATTVYWGKGTFHDEHYVDTLCFASGRGFSTSGESTLVFIGSIDCTGKLTGAIETDTSIIVTSDTDTDSTKSFWFLVIRE
jgi:hypothetical protein